MCSYNFVLPIGRHPGVTQRDFYPFDFVLSVTSMMLSDERQLHDIAFVIYLSSSARISEVFKRFCKYCNVSDLCCLVSYSFSPLECRGKVAAAAVGGRCVHDSDARSPSGFRLVGDYHRLFGL